MPAPRYPSGTVRALLASDLVTPPTRAALQKRLDAPGPPRFFGEAEMATLRAACARLIPQPGRAEPIDVAAAIDDRLARGDGNGWRYATLPPDGEAYRHGLAGLDASARALGADTFTRLGPDAQDDVLRAVQAGTPPGAAWAGFASARFFEELLAEAVELYYAHPLAQEEIGYVGMADAHGWARIGLDELEPHEPRSLTADAPDAANGGPP